MVTEALASPQAITLTSTITDGRTSSFNCNEAHKPWYRSRPPDLTFFQACTENYHRGFTVYIPKQRPNKRCHSRRTEGGPVASGSLQPHLLHVASNLQGVNTESQNLAPPQRQNYGSDCLLVDILNKKENIWHSGAMLAFSPAGMTQRTDSLGLQLNVKALFQGAIREQSREWASI